MYKWTSGISQFPIKILGFHFVNSVLDNNNWDKINEKLTKKIIFGIEYYSLREEKNQILSSKLWYIGQMYTIQKYIKKETEK